jgi:twinkle protein
MAGEGSTTTELEKMLTKEEAHWGMTLEEFEAIPIGTNTGRCITLEIAAQYGVRHDGHDIFYPHYQGEEVVGYKRRQLGVAKSISFSVKGDRSTLFGRNLYTKGSGKLLVVEGEEDCLAAKQMLTVGIVPQECDVVSLPNGASLDKSVKAQLDFFKGYKTVYLCLDNDKPGLAASAAIADWLIASVAVKIVLLDSKLGKDASDYHVAGHQKDFLRAIAAAKQYMPLGLVNGADIPLADLLEPEDEGYPLPFAGLQSALHGIRKGEIVMVCADSGIGKTTFTREITKCLIEQGLGVASIALEDQLKVTVKSLIALDMNIPLNVFKFAPPSMSECQPSYDKLIAGGKSYFYRHTGNLDNYSLLSTLSSYARSGSVDFIILDHIGVALAGTENNRMGEAKAIDILMNKLASLVTETGVGIVIVAHLKRQTDGVAHPEGREIRLTDLRGSAALEQYSFAVIGLERDQQAEEESDNNKVKVRVLKNRVFSRTGVMDRLLYVPETGRLVNAPRPEPVVLTGEVK